MSKNQKLILQLFSVACLIAIITCVIVNIAIDRKITWSLYPIVSVPFGWLVFSPLIIKKQGVVFSICSLMLFILPFLFLLDKITPIESWFLPLGIPSATVGMITIWAVFLMFRFVKISLSYKCAISLFFVGVFTCPAMNYYVDRFLDTGPRLLNNILNILSCVVIAVVIFVLGYRSNKSKRERAQMEEDRVITG